MGKLVCPLADSLVQVDNISALLHLSPISAGFLKKANKIISNFYCLTWRIGTHKDEILRTSFNLYIDNNSLSSINWDQ